MTTKESVCVGVRRKCRWRGVKRTAVKGYFCLPLTSLPHPGWLNERPTRCSSDRSNTGRSWGAQQRCSEAFAKCLNVKYAADFTEREVVASLYRNHTERFVVLEGRIFMSSLLYPGIRPGRSMALHSPYWRTNVTWRTSFKTRALGAIRSAWPCLRDVSPQLR